MPVFILQLCTIHTNELEILTKGPTPNSAVQPAHPNMCTDN